VAIVLESSVAWAETVVKRDMARIEAGKIEHTMCKVLVANLILADILIDYTSARAEPPERRIASLKAVSSLRAAVGNLRSSDYKRGGNLMIVLLILVISGLIFRGLGYAGIAAFASWQASAGEALSVMLFFTGVSHFTSLKEDFIRMMPPSIPYPRAMVYFTGICEIAGAAGLLIPGLRRAAGYALIVFFLAVLPANIHAARAGIRLRGKPATSLWLRILMQTLFIAIAFWAGEQGRL
jgi:uncharacterized membrane protein